MQSPAAWKDIAYWSIFFQENESQETNEQQPTHNIYEKKRTCYLCLV